MDLVYTQLMKNHIFTLIILSLLFMTLQVDLWVGQGGLLQFLQLRKELHLQIHENNLLKARNNILYAEVWDLKEGFDAIEERARVELGMIKPAETFYKIMDEAHE